jgi:hypothetical protein
MDRQYLRSRGQLGILACNVLEEPEAFASAALPEGIEPWLGASSKLI